MLRIKFKQSAVTTLIIAGVYLIPSGKLTKSLDQWRLFWDHEGDKITKIEQQYGIDIQYGVGNEVLPKMLRKAPANGTAESISRFNLGRYIKILSEELRKYPASLINRNISTIVLLNRLRFFGVQYDGTSLGNTIYLSCGPTNAGYDNRYLASLLHHEINAMFFRNYPFPLEAWKRENPDKFHYAKIDTQIFRAVEAHRNMEYSAALCRGGFVSSYGCSTLENDFCGYAEMAFTQPELLKRLADRYPRVKNKVAIMKEFYLNISKDFPDIF